MKKLINIASDFSEAPSGRFYEDGDFSGQAFREKILIPSVLKYDKIELNLDGTEGYGSSFLEEAFGGIVRGGYVTSDELISKLSIVSSRPQYIKKIKDHIKSAGTIRKPK